MTAHSAMPGLLTEAEAARLIGVPIKTLRNARVRGEVAYIRVTPKFIRYRANDLEACLARQTQEPLPVLPREIEPVKELTRRPCVYFIRSGKHGPIKIGYANFLQKRLHALRTAHHDELLVLATLAGGEVQEKRLHNQFAHLRKRGEWFEPAEELLLFIETLRNPL